MPERCAFVLTLPARAEYVSVVRHVLGGVVEEWDIDRHDLDDMQIAVTEACVNVVRHAYRNGSPGTMEVHGGLQDGKIVVTVRDSGPGITPHVDVAGLGMGIALMGALAERLEFGHAADGTHEVRMTFVRHEHG